MERKETMLTPQQITEALTTRFSGIIAKQSWGETALFYNPDHALPNGVYFGTVKEQNGENDQASRLERPGVFRFNVGIGTEAYTRRFGPKPTRPPKGQVVATGHDFSSLDMVLPHPIYAWMGWICILSPSKASLEGLWPEIEAAYRLARQKFQRRMK
jgi:hypothetical protein